MIIALGAVAIGFAFRSLLLEEAKAHITLTGDEIARVAEASNALGFYDAASALDTLANREQLDHWASPTNYVQIDTLKGYPIGKSSNMGDLRLAPFTPAAGDDKRFVFERGVDGVGLLVLDRLLSQNGKPLAIAHVASRLDIIERETQRARTILFFATVVAGIAVVIASLFIARNAVDPIVRLTAAMEAIGSEALDQRLRWRRTDELGKLAATFDAMLDRLQAAFARERQFISDASHELKTPLTVINANAQLIRRWGDRDPVVKTESLNAIVDESSRLAEMVSGMLTLAKADAGDHIPMEPLALGGILADVIAHATERAAAKGLVLRAELPDGTVMIAGDAPLIRQLISNLVDNAIKFTDAGEVVALLEAVDGSARITVRDSGPGIDAAVAERLFDRFFRADASHSRSIEGTGLGLAIVRSIARVHGGTVRARGLPAGGSAFTVDLPLLALDDESSRNLNDRAGSRDV